MSIEENKALVRRFYAELDNLNPAVIDELVAENFVNHSPPPFPVEQGRDGLKHGRSSSSAGRHQARTRFSTRSPKATR